MCGEQGFIAVHETVHLVNFIGKGCSSFFIFFSSAYVTLLSTKGYKHEESQAAKFLSRNLIS